jgi:hypothetical protein
MRNIATQYISDGYSIEVSYPRIMNQYLCRSLHQAISILATEKGDVRSLLLLAHKSVLYKLRDDDFSEEYIQDWVWIKQQMRKFGSLTNDEGKQILGSVENTMKKIQNITGVKIAEKFFDIGWKINTNNENSDSTSHLIGHDEQSSEI